MRKTYAEAVACGLTAQNPVFANPPKSAFAQAMSRAPVATFIQSNSEPKTADVEVPMTMNHPGTNTTTSHQSTVAYTLNGAKSLASLAPLAPDDPKSNSTPFHGRSAFFFSVTRNLLTCESELRKLLATADSENTRDTLVLVFHLRNCRKKNGGKGERDLWRKCVQWYVETGKGDLIQKNLPTVVEVGRWDDVLFCPGGYDYMAKQLLTDWDTLQEHDGCSDELKTSLPVISLAAKWAPSACISTKKSKGKSELMIAALNRVLSDNHDSAVSNTKKMTISLFREKEYRQMLSAMRRHLRVTESLMCDNKWEDIDFNQVPSNAMHNYGKKLILNQNARKRSRSRTPVQSRRHTRSSLRQQRTSAKRQLLGSSSRSIPGAFYRHCPSSFAEWTASLKSGKTVDGKVVKVNASQLFPHQIVRQLIEQGHLCAVECDGDDDSDGDGGGDNDNDGDGGGDNDNDGDGDDDNDGDGVETLTSVEQSTALAEAQWKVIEDDVRSRGTLSGCLFVTDVSGSMNTRIDSSSTRAVDVAISLSLLGSRCSTGIFQNTLITFSEKPNFFQIPEGSLLRAINAIEAMDWGSSTNLQSVFELILTRAAEFQLPQSEMPKMVCIISDMEFNVADPSNRSTNFEAIKQKYAASGYELPTVCFWNVASRSQQFPTSADEKGTILLSGFSSSMLTMIMNNGFANVNSWEVVQRVIDTDTYKSIVV